MSTDNKTKTKYLSAYIPDGKIKEISKRGSPKSDGKLEEVDEAVKALQDAIAKQNRDNLDAMYNIDMDNLSSSLKKLLASYSDGITNAQSSIQTWANAQEAGFAAVAKWQNETESSIAAVQAAADSNGAKISSIVQWQSTAENDIDGITSSVSSIKQTADKNSASISQIVTAVGSSGKVTAASIVTAVNASGSSVMISADKIKMTGTTTFLTADDVGDSGSTEISGNRISLNIDGTYDDGSTDLESDNGLNFVYEKSGGSEVRFCYINTSIDGLDSDVTSRYSLNLRTYSFRNSENTRVYPSIKIRSAGRVSVESVYGVYISCETSGGFITLDSQGNTAIRAYLDYSQMKSVGDGYYFCTDGIYYNGKRVLTVN